MRNKYILLTLIFVICIGESHCQSKKIKDRVVVLTDIGGDPDDEQSLIRFLLYSNMFDVEGIIPTSSVWYQKINKDKIDRIIDAYSQIQSNLIKHEPDFPLGEDLKSVVKMGTTDLGMKGVGYGKDSEGSDLIINIVDKNDNRPVWVLAWGGSNVLAQAIWKVSMTRSKIELESFIKKLRVYAISDQDDSGPWMRNNFKNLFYIVSPGREEMNNGGYHYATWTGISGDNFHGRFQGADFGLVDNLWIEENIRKNHGQLGELYPKTTFLMEGDSPSFMYLINNGLSDPEHPDYGSWGGRYEFYKPRCRDWYYEPEIREIWTNAEDEVFSEITKSYHTSIHATIWRWRQAYQNDFAARMDWTSKEYVEANHPPVVKVDKIPCIVLTSGEKVALNGNLSYDPDGDKLKYNWYLYKEPGDFNSSYFIINMNELGKISFIAPKVQTPKTMHLILEVTDDGSPSLSRYKRIIVTVIP